MQILTNARVASGQQNTRSYGYIEQGVVAIEGGKIAWCGEASHLPSAYQGWPETNLEGRLITPGLIDCHTHLVFGGHRAGEFEQRLTGVSYADIIKAGGGIVSTVTATRALDEDTLLDLALVRVDALIAEGVTAVEIKSGYGLDTDTELKMLRVARRIAGLRPLTVVTSFLGAHAIPKEFAGRADAYIDDICIPALRAAQAEGLVDSVDGFCESIAFSPAQIERVFRVARELELPVRLHAEQLTLSKGAELAAKYEGLSADHLEYLDESGVSAMASAGMVAVLLPGAFYTLRETQAPPIELLRKHGVPIAIATDCNPGSSPLASILMTLNMACTLFRLTPEESFDGVTRHAAKALGLEDTGMIAAGKWADLAIWDVEHPAELAYRIGFNSLHQRLYHGAP